MFQKNIFAAGLSKKRPSIIEARLLCVTIIMAGISLVRQSNFIGPQGIIANCNRGAQALDALIVTELKRVAHECSTAICYFQRNRDVIITRLDRANKIPDRYFCHPEPAWAIPFILA